MIPTTLYPFVNTEHFSRSYISTYFPSPVPVFSRIYLHSFTDMWVVLVDLVVFKLKVVSFSFFWKNWSQVQKRIYFIPQYCTHTFIFHSSIKFVKCIIKCMIFVCMYSETFNKFTYMNVKTKKPKMLPWILAIHVIFNSSNR